MENLITQDQTPSNEPIKLTKETAESIKTLIEAVGPYVQHHVEAGRKFAMDDRQLTMEAARQEREAGRLEREQNIDANKHANHRGFLLVLAIVMLAFASSAVFAWVGQWAVAEKLIIGMLSFAMGSRVNR